MIHFYKTIDGWFNFEHIYAPAVAAGTNGMHYVEIGSWLGKSSVFMAVEIANSGKQIRFDCVDTWNGSEEHQQDYDISTLYDRFLYNIEPVKDYITPVRMTSVEAAKLYADRSLDFVFIDGDHTYKAVAADLRAWWPKVRRLGYLGGHDYSCGYPGLDKALYEFFPGRDPEFVLPEFVDATEMGINTEWDIHCRCDPRYLPVYQSHQVDWMLGDPQQLTNEQPILLQETLNCAINYTEYQFYAVASSRTVPAYTYIRALDGFKNFKYLHIPYDFTHAGQIVTQHPLDRPKLAGYVYADHPEWKTRDGKASMVFGVIYHPQNYLKGLLSQDPRVRATGCGPMFEDKIYCINQYRFGIAAENCSIEGYLTEKLFDCIVADVVPIYFGHSLPVCLQPYVCTNLRQIDMSDREYMWRLNHIRELKSTLTEEYGYERWIRDLGINLC